MLSEVFLKLEPEMDSLRVGAGLKVQHPYANLSFPGPCGVAVQTVYMPSGHQMAAQDAIASGVAGPLFQVASVPGPSQPRCQVLWQWCCP